MRLSRRLIAAVAAAALSLSPLAASAQALGSGVAADNVWSFTPAPFPGVGVPSSGLTGYTSTPTLPPAPPSYNGEWVYTATSEMLPLPGNGFAWFKYVKTCINGTCDPVVGASLADWCQVDGWGVFTEGNSIFCPRRAIYG